jgi:type II secretion system protein L
VAAHLVKNPRIRVGRATLETGAFESESGAATLDASPVSGRCDLVVAADLVLLERLTVPAAQQRRVGEALRFLAEDAALPDPERLHVATEAAPPKDSVAVAIIERQWLKDLLARLERAGLSPQSAVPELLLPPITPGSWCVVCNGPESFARTGAAEGFALDSPRPGEVPVALTLAVSKETPDRIIVRAAPEAAIPEVGRWSVVLGVPVEAGPPWHWAEAPAHGAIELLQREFAPRGAERGWREKLRRPALLAGALVVLASVGIGIEWWSKAREQRELVAEMRAIYRETFGAAAVIVDPPLQMERALADLRGRSGAASPGDFLPLVAAVSELVDPARQRIELVAYERGRLQVVLKPHAAAQLGALRDELQAKLPVRGLDARVETVDWKSAPALRLTAAAEGKK